MTPETNQRLIEINIVPRRKVDELVEKAYWNVDARPNNGHPSFRGARFSLKKASTALRQARSSLAGRIVTIGCERKIGSAKRDIYSRAIPYHKSEIERSNKRYGESGDYDKGQIRLYERWLNRFGVK